MSTQVFANIMTRAVYYARKTTFLSMSSQGKIDQFVRCWLNCKYLEVWGWGGSGLTEAKPLEALLLGKPT